MSASSGGPAAVAAQALAREQQLDETVEDWATRVSMKQKARSPEKVDAALRHAERQVRAKSHYAKCSKMRCSNAVSSNAFFAGVRKVKSSRSAGDYEAHSSSAVRQMADVRKSMATDKGGKSSKYSRAMKRAPPPPAPTAVADADQAPAQDAATGGESMAQRAFGTLSSLLSSGPAPPLQDAAASSDAPAAANTGTAGTAGNAGNAEGVGDGELCAMLDEDETVMLEVAGELGLVKADSVAQHALAQQMQAEDEQVTYDSYESSRYRSLGYSNTNTVWSNLEASVQPIAQAEADDLLSQLRVEPATDAERASLFNLYEASYETVEKARQGMLEFWAEVAPDFEDHPAVKAALAAGISKLDSAENMGIQFVEGQWFVFGMCKKVTQNIKVVDRILADIRTKLELLGSQDECPVCLEPFSGGGAGAGQAEGEAKDEAGAGAGAAGPAGPGAGGAGDKVTVTLGCAHMVCGVCWEQWKKTQQRQHARAFCPLCRNSDFLQSVMRVVPS